MFVNLINLSELVGSPEAPLPPSMRKCVAPYYAAYALFPAQSATSWE